MPRRNRSGERGSTIVEFALVSWTLIFLFFGLAGVGIKMGRYTQAVQVARDVAHMYSTGVDFSLIPNKNIVTQKLAAGTGMTNNGGDGVVILSAIQTVYQADCDASGNSGNCTNKNLPVFTQRIVIGNSALRTSTYGTPASNILDAAGNISPNVYETNSNSSVRTSGFDTELISAMTRAAVTAPNPPQAQNDVAFVVEVYFQYPDLSFLGQNSGGGYAKFVYH